MNGINELRFMELLEEINSSLKRIADFLEGNTKK